MNSVWTAEFSLVALWIALKSAVGLLYIFLGWGMQYRLEYGSYDRVINVYIENVGLN